MVVPGSFCYIKKSRNDSESIFQKGIMREMLKLGYGMLRLPKLPGSKHIDLETSIPLIDLAMEQGVNYMALIFSWGHRKRLTHQKM